jgi:hypothetical protein
VAATGQARPWAAEGAAPPGSEEGEAGGTLAVVPAHPRRRARSLAIGVLLLCLIGGAAGAGAAIPGLADGCPAASAACDARTARLLAFLDERVSGGSFGFVLAGVDGPVLASLRADEGFYPASSIKVLYLLEAVRWVGSRDDPVAALRTLLPVNTDGCGGGMLSLEPLDTVLLAMMRQSDNLRANAVGDFFGLEAVNQTAHDLGGVGAGSSVAHRFACGGPANDPANRMTAADLAGVYERYGAGTLLDAPTADLFASYFLDAGTGVLDTVVAEEAAALGRPDLAAWFGSRVELIYKAGWWETDLSVGGYAALPRRGCGAVDQRGLAFAAFVSEADAVASGFDITESVGEMLREEIRAALITLSLPAHSCRATWAPRPG